MARIPYGTKYTAQVTGARWKPVSCENCGCEYLYLAKVKVEESATNVLWLNKRAAISKAENNAAESLEYRLKEIVLNYPCPACGFYQAHMLQRMKHQIWKNTLILGFFAAVLTFLIASGNSTSPEVIAIVTGVFISSFFWSRLINFDPNTDVSSRVNKKFSEKYPVVRKSEFDSIITRHPINIAHVDNNTENMGSNPNQWVGIILPILSILGLFVYIQSYGSFVQPIPEPTRHTPSILVSTPTRKPAPTTTKNTCLHWSKVTPEMLGKKKCVYGTVSTVHKNYQAGQSFIYFGAEDQFFFTSESVYNNSDLKEKCIQTTGIVGLNTYKVPYILVGSSIEFCK